MVDVEKANGTDEEQDVPPERARPAVEKTKDFTRSNNSKRIVVLLMIACAIILTAVLVPLLPDDEKEEEPSVKPTNPDPPTSNGTYGLIQSSSIDCLGVLTLAFPHHPIVSIATENVTRGYNSSEDLEDDLTAFAFLTLNQQINGSGGWGDCDVYLPENMDSTSRTANLGSESGGGNPTASRLPLVVDGIDSFGTNSQESGIDTADRTKTDGSFVYASYGDYLIVLKVEDGNITSTIQLPKVDIPEEYYDYFYAKPYIEAILLEGDHLALVVSGYGAEYQVQLGTRPVICNYMATRIVIFKKNDGSPQFVSQRDIHGSFHQAYSTNSNGHVVTQSQIDTWTHLRTPILRSKFPDLTDDEYREEAAKIGKELVPKFVASLTQLLYPFDLTRLSLFVDSLTSEDVLDGVAMELKLADKISMVSSFVIDSDDTGASDVLDVSVGGALQPGPLVYVYATDQMLVLADSGRRLVEGMHEYVAKSSFTCFRLDGASSRHEISGSVFGVPLDPYAIDIVERDGMVYLRVATWWKETESSTWNEIVVLGTESGTGMVLERLSSVRLGKPNEVRTGKRPLLRFKAVHFLDDIAYAVTSFQTDTLYAVNLTDPLASTRGGNLSVWAELGIAGSARYLRPIGNGKILTIGDEAGIDISLFGAAADSSNTLKLLDRNVLQNQENEWNSKLWEPQSVRYFSVHDGNDDGEMGFLVIPWTVYTMFQGSLKHVFRGFEVWKIRNDTFLYRYAIDHGRFENGTNDNCKKECGSLDERSFVIDGNVITLRDQSAQGDSWSLDLSKELCCDDGTE
eukprot:scaffold2744_cov136-Cylindrotheca_fusiformis.AAC.21